MLVTPAGPLRASNPVLVRRLHEAAAEGRTADVLAALAQGVGVDAPDGAGETALMASIRNRRYETVAELRRRGARLDLRNVTGLDARSLVLAMHDEKMDLAAGVVPLNAAP